MGEFKDILDLLKPISNEVVVKQFSSDISKNFEATIRLKYDEMEGASHSEKCDLWKTKYEDLTNTGYVVRKTRPQPKRFLYKKSYICQHSNVKKSNKCNKQRSRNQECNDSCLCITMKNKTTDTMKKDKLLRKGFDVEIKIVFQHTHRTEVADALGYLRISTATKEKFYNYFSHRMGPAESKLYHEMNIIAQNEENGTSYSKILANARMNPLMPAVKYLFQKWRTSAYGDRSKKSMAENLLQQKSELEAKGHKLVVTENPFCVALLTPVMQRAHKQKFASEICFVDSSGSCDQSGATTTFFFSASKVGGIPLGVAFHLHQTQEDYQNAFECIKEAAGSDAFFGKGSPDIFMSDDSAAERSALSSVFPDSQLLLCHFHICQSVWRWLWDSKNSILKEHRKFLMYKFREMLYTEHEISFDELYQKFLIDEIVSKYPKYVAYIKNLVQRKREWALCYRASLSTRGNNTNNICEASIRIFKDIVLARCRAFNTCALVQFVINILEKYHTRRLLGFAHNQDSSHEIQYQKLLTMTKDLAVTQKNDDCNIFFVSSSTDKTLLYTIGVQNQTCDCIKGQDGRFCKHILAVCEKFKLHLSNHPQLSSADRAIMAYIAQGKAESPDFYMSMRLNIDEAAEVMMLESQFQPTNEQNGDAPAVQDVSTQISDVECKQEINIMIEEMSRIGTILKQNPTSFVYKKLKSLNTKLRQIQTIEGFVETLCEPINSTRIKSTRINVQPTSQARRVNRNLGAGKRRVPSGQLTKEERVSLPVAKRRRNLGENISKNQPNAKSHGTNH